MQNSVQAERRLVQVFLYGLPLLVARYTTESLVVVRGSKKVQQLLQDARYKEYITLVNDGHRIALERIERAMLPMEERIAAQLLVERSAMQQAKSLPQASTTMLVGSKAQLVTSHTCVVVESESEDQQAPLAKFPKSGTLLLSTQWRMHSMNGQKLSPEWRNWEVGKNCQNKAEPTSTRGVIWFSVYACSLKQSHMGYQQKQQAGFIHMYNNKGACH